MSTKMIEQERRVWQNFIVLTEAVHREVGRDLWDDAQLTETEFTVLAELSSQDDGTMRPSLCARAINWEPSRLSHQLRRMEKRGLIARGRGDGSDGRAATITLTGAGRSAYRRAIGPHLRSAKRWFIDALDEDSLAHLDDTLGVLIDHIQQTAESSAPADRGNLQSRDAGKPSDAPDQKI